MPVGYRRNREKINALMDIRHRGQGRGYTGYARRRARHRGRPGTAPSDRLLDRQVLEDLSINLAIILGFVSPLVETTLNYLIGFPKPWPVFVLLTLYVLALAMIVYAKKRFDRIR